MIIFLANLLKFLLDNIVLVTASILLTTLILALIKSKREKITLGVQTLYDLQNEYRSAIICQAKNQILYHYNDVCNGDRDRWIEYYFNLIKTQADLDIHRQIYSHFYQKLANFYVKGIIKNDLLFPSWSWKDLETIGEIILPIEENFPEPSKTALYNLRKLYNDFSRWKRKDC